MSAWQDQVKAWPVGDLLARAGIETLRVGTDVSFPCLVCGKKQRHTKGGHNKKLSAKIVHDGSGFWCEPCQLRGDVVDAATLLVVGKKNKQNRLTPDEWGQVRQWSAAIGLCEADPRERGAAPRVAYKPPPLRVEPPPAPPPPKAEVDAFWAECLSLDAVKSWDGDEHGGKWCGLVRSYMATGRGLDVMALVAADAARIVQPANKSARPAWAKWGDAYRLAVPMVNARGELVTFRFRCVTESSGPKEGAASGSARGCFCASPAVVAMLRGGALPSMLVVTEGTMDFLAAVAMRPDAAVMSVVPGSASGLAEVKLPNGFKVRVATHEDDAGERYAKEIREAWPRADVVRVSMGAT